MSHAADRVGCIRASITTRSSFNALDALSLDGDDLRSLPLSLRKTNLVRLLARRPDGIFIAPFEQREIGPDLFQAARRLGLEGMVSKRRIVHTAPEGRRTGSRSKIGNAQQCLGSGMLPLDHALAAGSFTLPPAQTFSGI
jgi:hypothetical protein